MSQMPSPFQSPATGRSLRLPSTTVTISAGRRQVEGAVGRAADADVDHAVAVPVAHDRRGRCPRRRCTSDRARRLADLEGRASPGRRRPARRSPSPTKLPASGTSGQFCDCGVRAEGERRAVEPRLARSCRSRRSSKCRCGPVELPVSPSEPEQAALVDGLADADVRRSEVGVERRLAVAVVDHDVAAVAARAVGHRRRDHAGRRRDDRVADVVGAVPVDRRRGSGCGSDASCRSTPARRGTASRTPSAARPPPPRRWPARRRRRRALSRGGGGEVSCDAPWGRPRVAQGGQAG